MQIDTWPRIVCERLQGESLAQYRERSERITEIMTGFRMGRYPRDMADKMERELIMLQEQGFERMSA